MEDFKLEIIEEIRSTIALDFDGVVHRYSKGLHDCTIYDDPMPGTLNALKELSKKFKIVIFTCRADPKNPLVNGRTAIGLIWEWLIDHGLAVYVDRVTAIKPKAMYYVDDKGIKFTNWEEVLCEIFDAESSNK